MATIDPDRPIPYTLTDDEPDLAAIALTLLEVSVALGMADAADVNKRLVATDALTALELTEEI